MRFDAVPFDESIGKTSDLPIVYTIYAYDNPNKFRTIILRINLEIYTKEMKHAMLWPNQDRENGTIIDDTPPHLDYTGTVTFTIASGDFDSPLEKYGLTAYINLRRPSEEETENCPIIDITYEDEWDPYKVTQNISEVNSTPILKSEGTISYDESIYD